MDVGKNIKKAIANLLAVVIIFHALGIPSLIASESAASNKISSDCMHEMAGHPANDPAVSWNSNQKDDAVDCLTLCRELTGKAVFNLPSNVVKKFTVAEQTDLTLHTPSAVKKDQKINALANAPPPATHSLARLLQTSMRLLN